MLTKGRRSNQVRGPCGSMRSLARLSAMAASSVRLYMRLAIACEKSLPNAPPRVIARISAGFSRATAARAMAIAAGVAAVACGRSSKSWAQTAGIRAKDNTSPRQRTQWHLAWVEKLAMSTSVATGN
jgi:hypothetical protein